jgi:hypothetical protein
MPVSESNPSGSNPLIPKGHTYNVPLTVGVRSCCKKRFDNSQDGNKLGDDCCSIKSQCALFECVSCVWVVTGEHCCKTCSKIMCSECCDVLEVYECGNCRFLTPGSDDLVPPQPQSGNVPSPGNFLLSALWQTLCCVKKLSNARWGCLYVFLIHRWICVERSLLHNAPQYHVGRQLVGDRAHT